MLSRNSEEHAYDLWKNVEIVQSHNKIITWRIKETSYQ